MPGAVVPLFAPMFQDGFVQAGGSLVAIASVRAGSGSGTSGSSSAGFGGGFGRSSGPMDSAAIRALLADPNKLKILMSNLLSERRKEVRRYFLLCQGVFLDKKAPARYIGTGV